MPAAHRAAPFEDLDRQAGERAAGAELRQLELQRLTGVGRPQEDHAGRDDAPALRVAAGGDDGLPEHLAALDDRPSFVAPGDRDEAAVAVVGRADVHDVDEVRGVAPGGEALARHVPWRVPRRLVRDLDQHPVLVEGNVAVEFGQRFWRPQALRQAFERVELNAGLDVGHGEEEHGELAGRLTAQAGVGLHDELIAPPCARRVGVARNFHVERKDRSAQPAARVATVTEGMWAPS